MTTITYLHLSDLHWGHGDQKAFWPSIRAALHARLDMIRAYVNQWDLVLFTGDLVDKGENFDEMHSEVLAPLLNHLSQGQSKPPILLAVPGNHDLCRPTPSDAAMFGAFGPETQNAIMDPNAHQFKVLTRAFEDYQKWFDGYVANQPDLTVEKGPLPGDFAATFSREGCSLGIAGINSAFLQLSAADFEGRLAILLRQFQQATGGDCVAWSKRHQIRLLLTHHPPAWLSDEHQNILRTEILAGGSIDAHLCGHLHVSRSSHVGMPGARDIRTYQVASLFGRDDYEQVGGGAKRRHHGITVGRIEIGQRIRQLRIWPLKAKEVPNHGWVFERDGDAGLRLQDDGGTYPIDLSDPGTAPATPEPKAFFDLEDLLYGVVTDAKSLVDADAASIFLYDKDTDRYVLRESTEMTPYLGRASLDPDTNVQADHCGITAFAAFDDRVLLVDEVRKHPKWTKYGVEDAKLSNEPALDHCELQPADLRSMIVVPFKGQDKDTRPAGVLRVVRGRAKQPFTDEHKKKLLSQLNDTAPKIAGALSLSQLIAMGSILERDALCRQAVDLVLNLVRGRGCSIFLLDDKKSSEGELVYRCSATTGLKGKLHNNPIEATYTIPNDAEKTFTGYVAANRRNVVVDNLNQSSFQDQYHGIARNPGDGKHRELHNVPGTHDTTGACMFAPLLFREQFDTRTPALGVIRVTKTEIDPPFDTGEQRRFFMFADRLSQTLRQVRYMELLRRLSLEGSKAIEYCAQEVPRLLGGRGCSIFLVDKQPQQLKMRATFGNLTTKFSQNQITPYELATSADGLIITRSFTVHALNGDVLWNDEDELRKLEEKGIRGSGRMECELEVEDHPPRRFLATRIPDPTTRESIGVIRIPKSAKECPFTSTDVKLLQSIADHLGIALHRGEAPSTT